MINVVLGPLGAATALERVLRWLVEHHLGPIRFGCEARHAVEARYGLNRVVASCLIARQGLVNA